MLANGFDTPARASPYICGVAARSKADVGGQSLSALYLSRKKNMDSDDKSEQSLALVAAVQPKNSNFLDRLFQSGQSTVNGIKEFLASRAEPEGDEDSDGSPTSGPKISIKHAIKTIRDPYIDRDARDTLTVIIHQWSFLFETDETMIDRYCTLLELLYQCQLIKHEYEVAEHANERIDTPYDKIGTIVNYDCLLLMYVGFLKRIKGSNCSSNFADIDAWYCFLRDWAEIHHKTDVSKEHLEGSINIHNILLEKTEATPEDFEDYHKYKLVNNLVTRILMHEREQRVRECEEQEKFVHNLLFHLELTLDIVSRDSILATDMISRNKGNPFDISLVLHRVELVLENLNFSNECTKTDENKDNFAQLVKVLTQICTRIKGGYIFSHQMTADFEALYICAIKMNGNLEYTPSKKAIRQRAYDTETFEEYASKYGAYSIYFMYMKTQHNIEIVDTVSNDKVFLVKNDKELFDVVFQPRCSLKSTQVHVAPEFVTAIQNIQFPDLLRVYTHDAKAPETFYKRRNIILGKNGFSYDEESEFNASEKYHVDLSALSHEKKSSGINVVHVWERLSASTRKKVLLLSSNTTDPEAHITDICKKIGGDKMKHQALQKIPFLCEPKQRDDFFHSFVNVDKNMQDDLNCLAAYFCIVIFNASKIEWKKPASYYCRDSTDLFVESPDSKEGLHCLFRRMHTEPLFKDSVALESIKTGIPFLKDYEGDLKHTVDSELNFLWWIQLAGKITPRADVKICDVVGAWKDGLDTFYGHSIVEQAFNNPLTGTMAQKFKDFFDCQVIEDEDEVSESKAYKQPSLRTESPPNHSNAGGKDAKMLHQLKDRHKEFERLCTKNSETQQAFEQMMFSAANIADIKGLRGKCILLSELLTTWNNHNADISAEDKETCDILSNYVNKDSEKFENDVNPREYTDDNHDSDCFVSAKQFYLFLFNALRTSILKKRSKQQKLANLLETCVHAVGMLYWPTNLDVPDIVKPSDPAIDIEALTAITSELANLTRNIDSITTELGTYGTGRTEYDVFRFYIHVLKQIKNVAGSSTNYLFNYAKKTTKNPPNDAMVNYAYYQCKKAQEFTLELGPIMPKLLRDPIPVEKPEKHGAKSGKAAFGGDNLEQASACSFKAVPQAVAPWPVCAAGTDTACANGFQHAFPHAPPTPQLAYLPLSAALPYAVPQTIGPYTGGPPMGAGLFPAAPQHWSYGQGGAPNVLQMHPARDTQMYHVVFLP